MFPASVALDQRLVEKSSIAGRAQRYVLPSDEGPTENQAEQRPTLGDMYEAWNRTDPTGTDEEYALALLLDRVVDAIGRDRR